MLSKPLGILSEGFHMTLRLAINVLSNAVAQRGRLCVFHSQVRVYVEPSRAGQT